MTRRGLAGVAAAVLALAACSDPVTPRGDSGPRTTLVPQNPCTVDCPTGGGGGGTTPPLTVTVSGPSYVSTASNVVYTSAASGGSGARSYVWTEHVCYGASNSPCADNVLDPYGMWYIHHSIASNVCTDEMIVTVTDATGHWARASKVTSGPACLL
ncbi:MAG: hypothetical protein JWM27_1635 [Gemmatimonadetes bacterium]|nr:hypothetical protein [Gemmatimonadota bacterium]